ncbi:MAG: undecaprenyl-diphosphate phosphatase, partial [Bacteroidales bacterium]
MTIVECIILGVVQGLTEFLPISSSGHLLLARELFGIEEGELIVEVTLHAATSLAILVLFRKEIYQLFEGLFKFQLNPQTLYILKIAISMVPIFIIGVFFKERVESLFGEGLAIVGPALLVTALLLLLSERIEGRKRGLTFGNAFIIGVA